MSSGIKASGVKVVNHILKMQNIGVVRNGNKNLDYGFATGTDSTKRPFMPQKTKDEFAAVLANVKVPAGATKAILTDIPHKSNADHRPHWSIAWFNVSRFLTKTHEPVKEPKEGSGT